MSTDHATQLRRTRRLISATAIVGIGAAAVWFVFAAIDEPGGQLTAAGATAAGLGTAWSAGFATITSRLRSIETASTSAR
ncbi:hypothetical protein [Microbacterium sp. PAMC22086]|uniref:hypothetical protein n=1 Tax=Microbacterium sp. PAMC22086 TaxID=2861281 RepID=UPI001C632020|nr:hypothetical protein [Microbacterium sp. PAMC22086]QYG12448.1 hypothetical protein KY497_03980 [Microbacterium sp. PAMC22086]